jgi:hypothetical protein
MSLKGTKYFLFKKGPLKNQRFCSQGLIPSTSSTYALKISATLQA